MEALRLALKEIIREVVREELAARSVDKPTVEYLSTAQAAAFAGVTPGTIRRWKDEGRLTPAGAGRELRFLRAEIATLMQRSTSGRARRARVRQSSDSIAADIVRSLAGR